MPPRAEGVLALTRRQHPAGLHRMAEVRIRTGLTARQIRYYDQQGLVVPMRSRGGHRLYTDAQVVRLLAVKALLATGRSLAQVADELDRPAPPPPLSR